MIKDISEKYYFPLVSNYSYYNKQMMWTFKKKNQNYSYYNNSKLQYPNSYSRTNSNKKNSTKLNAKWNLNKERM